MIFRLFSRAIFAFTATLMLAACGINSVPTAEENAKAKWADVEAAFQERANLNLNLEKVVIRSGNQEDKTLTGVAKARASATSPQVKVDANDLTDPAKIQAYQAAQNNFSGAMSRLLVSVEDNPELRSQANFGRFMRQLEGQENRIRIAIRDYNDAVREYNTTIRTFPDTIGANLIHGAEPMVPYTAVTEGSEVAPTLNMSNEVQQVEAGN